MGKIRSDVFSDKWETQTLTGTLETLLLSSADRLNSKCKDVIVGRENTRMSPQTIGAEPTSFHALEVR